MATINEHGEPVLQDPLEPVVIHEGEQQQPHIEQASTNKGPRRSQRVRKPVIPDDYEVYECEEFQMKSDPTCRQNMVGSLPRGMPKVVDYRQTDAQATNKMVT